MPAEIVQTATKLLRAIMKESAELCLSYYEREVRTEIKKDGSLLTEADLAINQLIVDRIREQFPSHSIVSEEAPAEHLDASAVWIIDPIDGTLGFKTRNGFFCHAVSFTYNNQLSLSAILAPAKSEYFEARLGFGATLNSSMIAPPKKKKLSESRLLVMVGEQERAALGVDRVCAIAHSLEPSPGWTSASLAIAYCALAKVDCLIWSGDTPWDIAPGYLLAQESGLTVSGVDGLPFVADGRRGNGVVIAQAGVHADILRLLSKAPH